MLTAAIFVLVPKPGSKMAPVCLARLTGFSHSNSRTCWYQFLSSICMVKLSNHLVYVLSQEDDLEPTHGTGSEMAVLAGHRATLDSCGVDQQLSLKHTWRLHHKRKCVLPIPILINETKISASLLLGDSKLYLTLPPVL